MPKGRSFSADQWEAFDKGGQSFVHDDFAHQKFLQFKAKLENPNEGIVLKESISERSDGISSVGEVKFWLNIHDYSLYTKIGTDSNMNVQLDTGIKQIKGIKSNVYFGGEVNRTFTQRQAFAGIEFFQDKKWSINSKFSHSFTNKTSLFSQKFSLNVKEWRFNGFGTFDISKTILTKCGLLAAWTPAALDSKSSYFFSLNSPKNVTSINPKTLFQNAVLAVNREVSDTQTLGLEAKINILGAKSIFSNPSNLFPSIWLASQWRFGQATVKAKISKDLSHMITIKNKIGGYGFYSLGVAASEIGSKNRFKFGVQVDLNL